MGDVRGWCKDKVCGFVPKQRARNMDLWVTAVPSKTAEVEMRKARLTLRDEDLVCYTEK